MNLMSRFAAIIAVPLFLMLVACETVPPAQSLPDISFTHLPPMTLDVASIEIVSEYTSPFTEPNVEHLFPVTPRAALETWATDRLRAGGSVGRARFVILNAAAIKSVLQKTEGLQGVFKKEESDRYDGDIEARLEIYNAAGTRMAYAVAHADRHQTMLEDASPNDRRRVWFDMVNSLMQDFNREMERAIRDQLPGVVR